MKIQKINVSYRAILFIAVFFSFGLCADVFANTFDGTKISINAPTTGGVPSITYLGGDIYLSDTFHTLSLTACPGQPAPTFSGGVWTVPRNTTTGYWCFESSAADHTIYYNTPPLGPRYKWLPNTNTTGFQNVKDFGAVGDGTTDDTAAVTNAVHYLGSKQGGTLYFSIGDFKITGTINLPPAILIQGAMGKATSTFTNAANPKSPSRILLAAKNTAAFRIGENNENVRFKNIEITATTTVGTIGVEGIGKFTEAFGGTTQLISFDNVIFSLLDRGIYVHDVSDSGSFWQFDYVKVESCYFLYNQTAGIYVNLHNSDWNIISSFFFLPAANVPAAPAAADGMRFQRIGAVLVQNTFGGGNGYDSGQTYAQGGDFIDADETGSMTIINSGSERSNNSIVYGNTQYTGNFYHSLMLSGSIFGDPILLKQKVRFTSSGNFYGGATVNATDPGVVIYSTGDRFCYDSVTQPVNPCGNLAPGQSPGFQGVGKIVFQTGQEADGPTPAINATIGNNVDIKGKVTFSVLTLAQVLALPAPGAGAVVYCSNCNAGTAPCTAGGSGALAVNNGTQWACK